MPSPDAPQTAQLEAGAALQLEGVAVVGRQGGEPRWQLRAERASGDATRLHLRDLVLRPADGAGQATAPAADWTPGPQGTLQMAGPVALQGPQGTLVGGGARLEMATGALMLEGPVAGSSDPPPQPTGPIAP